MHDSEPLTEGFRAAALFHGPTRSANGFIEFPILLQSFKAIFQQAWRVLIIICMSKSRLDGMHSQR